MRVTEEPSSSSAYVVTARVGPNSFMGTTRKSTVGSLARTWPLNVADVDGVGMGAGAADGAPPECAWLVGAMEALLLFGRGWLLDGALALAVFGPL